MWGHLLCQPTRPRSYSHCWMFHPLRRGDSLRSAAPGQAGTVYWLWFIVGIYTPPLIRHRALLRSLIAGLRGSWVIYFENIIYLFNYTTRRRQRSVTSLSVTLYSMITITLIGFSTSTPWGDAKTFAYQLTVGLALILRRRPSAKSGYVLFSRISCNKPTCCHLLDWL